MELIQNRKKHILLIFVFMLIIINNSFSDNAMEIKPIDIKSNKYFMTLQPWKDGKLATIDGWGRFSEISFEKNNRLKITLLINFPRTQLDRDFLVWPDEDLFFARTGKMVHLADIGTKKTKSFIPLLSWLHSEKSPVMLDPVEGLLLFLFQGMNEDSSLFQYVIYNYKKDVIVFESEENSNIGLFRPLDREWILSKTFIDGKILGIDIYLYNWKTREVKRNKLTDILTSLQFVSASYGYGYDINLKKRYIVSDSSSLNKQVKIDWNEDFSEVTSYPIEHLIPSGKYYSDFMYFSNDGEWATTQIGGYKGILGERLQKRVFFHMHNIYPGGMSIAILSEGYEELSPNWGSFFNHPEYGMCYAKEHYVEDQLYLRIYKMSDVKAEIERQLLEKKNEAIKN